MQPSFPLTPMQQPLTSLLVDRRFVVVLTADSLFHLPQVPASADASTLFLEAWSDRLGAEVWVRALHGGGWSQWPNGTYMKVVVDTPTTWSPCLLPFAAEHISLQARHGVYVSPDRHVEVSLVAPFSMDCSLSSLSLNASQMLPAFNPQQYRYSMDVFTSCLDTSCGDCTSRLSMDLATTNPAATVAWSWNSSILVELNSESPQHDVSIGPVLLDVESTTPVNAKIVIVVSVASDSRTYVLDVNWWGVKGQQLAFAILAALLRVICTHFRSFACVSQCNLFLHPVRLMRHLFSIHALGSAFVKLPPCYKSTIVMS